MAKKKSSGMLQSTKFNRRSLMFFAAGFALIGAYFLYSSFAATAFPVVYTTSTVDTSNNITTTVKKIMPDGTGGLSYAKKTYNPSLSGSTSVLMSSAKYSRDHTMIAWATAPNGSCPGSVVIRALSSTTNKTYSMPGCETLNYLAAYSPIAWYPNENSFLVETYNFSTQSYTLWKVNSSGVFTSILKLGTGNNYYTSIAVLGDGKTIVFTNYKGVELLNPSATSPVLVSTALTNGNLTPCPKVRARPTTQNEFVYSCWNTNGNSSATIYDQTTSGAPKVVYATTGNWTAPAPTTASGLLDFTLSPDNSKITLYLQDLNFATTGCTMSTRLSNISYVGTGLGDVVQVLPIGNNCNYGTHWKSGDTVKWSPDSQNIAYIKPINYGYGGYGNAATVIPGNLYRFPATSTTATPKQLDTNVIDASW